MRTENVTLVRGDFFYDYHYTTQAGEQWIEFTRGGKSLKCQVVIWISQTDFKKVVSMF